jgi:hypothetical protein
MTNEEIEKFGKELVEHYGDKLPNPIHEPIRFAYYIKLFKYERQLNEHGRGQI